MTELDVDALFTLALMGGVGVFLWAQDAWFARKAYRVRSDGPPMAPRSYGRG